MAVSDTTASSYRESAITDQDFFEATSVPPQLLGVSSPGEQSATESVQQSTNANKKIALIIKNLSQTLFIPVFNMLLRLEQTYESNAFLKQIAGRVLDSDIEAINDNTKKIIEGEFELNASLGIDKQAQLNKWFLLMDRANQSNASTANMVQLGVVAPENAKFIDVSKFYDKVLPIVGEKDVEEYKISAQQPPLEAQGTAPGQASQPALPGGSPIQAVSNSNPEGTF